jgi:hypothetical protein
MLFGTVEISVGGRSMARDGGGGGWEVLEAEGVIALSRFYC